MFRFFSDDGTTEAIRRLAEAPELNVFVGAGSSKEVGLPTWRELIDRLVNKAIAQLDEGCRADVREYLLDSGLLAAADRVERLLDADDMTGEIREAIYGSDDPAGLVPGPLTTEVASLKLADPGVRILTTNYDQLIVSATRSLGGDASSYCTDSTQLGAVLHLHGVIGFEEPADGANDVVLTEHDYLAPNAGGWRTDAVRKAVNNGLSLFVGASLTDLNLLAPLHRLGPVRPPEQRHVVVFVREPARSESASREIEQIELARWGALGVQPLFADNFVDVAQFVAEVNRCRTGPTPYEPLGERVRRWYDSTVVPLIQATDTPNVPQYARSQRVLANSLADLLQAVQASYDLQDEIMQLGVFAVGCAGTSDFATVVATSDRVMLDPRSSERLPLDQSTAWTGIRAITSGVPVCEKKDNYASRWKHMLAVPVWSEDQPGCCVGSVVLSSTSQQSKLGVIGGGSAEVDDYVGLYDALREAGRSVLMSTNG